MTVDDVLEAAMNEAVAASVDEAAATAPVGNVVAAADAADSAASVTEAREETVAADAATDAVESVEAPAMVETAVAPTPPAVAPPPHAVTNPPHAVAPPAPAVAPTPPAVAPTPPAAANPPPAVASPPRAAASASAAAADGVVSPGADDDDDAGGGRGRPSRAAATGDTNPDSIEKLPAGVQAGLRRLVKDHVHTVKAMLANPSTEADDGAEVAEVLARLCAGVIRQQRLSPSGFLTRFFDKNVLAQHAAVLGKSDKGGVPVLAERVAGAWLRGPTFDIPRPPPKPSAKQRKADELAAKAAAAAAAKEAVKREKEAVKRAKERERMQQEKERAKAREKAMKKASGKAKRAAPDDAGEAGSSPVKKKKKKVASSDAAAAAAMGDGKIVLPPNAPPLATCAKCEEMFVLSHNRHGACFGHAPEHAG